MTKAQYRRWLYAWEQERCAARDFAGEVRRIMEAAEKPYWVEGDTIALDSAAIGAYTAWIQAWDAAVQLAQSK